MPTPVPLKVLPENVTTKVFSRNNGLGFHAIPESMKERANFIAHTNPEASLIAANMEIRQARKSGLEGKYAEAAARERYARGYVGAATSQLPFQNKSAGIALEKNLKFVADELTNASMGLGDPRKLSKDATYVQVSARNLAKVNMQNALGAAPKGGPIHSLIPYNRPAYNPTALLYGGFSGVLDKFVGGKK